MVDAHYADRATAICGKAQKNGPIDAAEHQRRLELHGQGLNDREIAPICGVTHPTVAVWRKKHGLPLNAIAKRMTEADRVKRQELYDAGLCDQDIADAIGVHETGVGVWRRKHDLPSNLGDSKLTDAEKARRMLFYQLGWSDLAIERELKLGYRTILKWRQQHGLPANWKRGPNQRVHERTTLESMFARIRKAIGRRLPPDIADDAVMDLCTAVLDGTIPIREIEAQARKVGNRVLDKYASKFGPRSLDEELGDSDGFRMIDLIQDHHSTSWLEEMGATVF